MMRVICVLAALACATAAPAFAADPGVTDTTIKVATSGPISGPNAVIGNVPLGIELKVKAVNAAGGVRMGDGKTRTIELLVQDDAGEPQRTLTNVRKAVEQSQVFGLIGVVGTPNVQIIKPYVNQRHVPDLFVYSAVYEWGDERANPWSIGLVPSFTTEAAVHAQYLKAKKPDAKVALLYLNTDFGQNFMAGFKSAIDGSRIELVATQPTGLTDPTVDTQLTNLKASGADTLLIATVPKYAAQAVRFGAETGWRPTIMITYAASSVAALKPAGLDNAKGVFAGQFMKPIDAPLYAADPGLQAYLRAHDQFRPRFEKDDTLGQMGYLIGDGLVRVLERMKEPTREEMMAVARNLDHVPLDLLLPGITLTTKAGSDAFPIESMQLFEFDGAAYAPVGEIISYEGKTPKL